MRILLDTFIEVITYHYRRGHIGFDPSGEIVILGAATTETPIHQISRKLTKTNLAKQRDYDRQHQLQHKQCNTCYRDFDIREDNQCPYCYQFSAGQKQLTQGEYNMISTARSVAKRKIVHLIGR